MELFVYTFKDGELVYRALSPLNPDMVQARGLPAEAVLGQINALLPSMTPDQFEENDAFKAVLHEVCREFAPYLESLKGEAAAIGTGELFLFDQRAGKVTGETGKEDVIGRFEVDRGRVDPQSYQPNEAYRVLTDNGPLSLPPLLESELTRRLSQSAAAQDEQESV